MSRSGPRLTLAKFHQDYQVDGCYKEVLSDTKFLIERQYKTVRRRSEHDPKSQAVADYIKVGIGTYIALAARELGDVETIALVQEQLALLQALLH